MKASTEAGGITAWFVSTAKPGTCDFQSSDGDIVVYLPRKLPITIDAQIQDGDDHRVIFDPAFPVKITYDDVSNGTRRLRAAGELNGGGEVLRLRTVAGNIRLMLSDADKQLVMYRQQWSNWSRICGCRCACWSNPWRPTVGPEARSGFQVS